MTYDVIVIGSGISGMASAIFAAKENSSCLLLEKDSHLGGSIRGYYNKGRYYPFGLSLLGSLNQGELLHKLMNYLGVYDKIELCDFPQREIYTILLEGKRISIPSDKDQLHDLLASMFPKEQEALDRFFRLLDDFIKENTIYRLEIPDKSWGLLRFYLDHGDTLWERIKTFEDFRLQKILASFISLFGVFVKDAPFFIYGMILLSFLSGTKYIKGGGIKLAKALEASCEREGVDIRKSEAVVNIECQGRMATSVVTTKGVYQGKNIIFSCEPRALLSLVDEAALNSRFVSKLQSYRDGISVFASYFEVTDEKGISPDDHYRNFICVDTKTMPMTIDDFERNSSEQLIELEYLMFFTNYDNGRLQIYTVLPDSYRNFEQHKERGPEYEHMKNRLELLLKERIEALIPDFRGKLKPVLSFTPLTIEDYLGYTRGSIFGLYASSAQKGLRSILPYTPIKNLYLVGQNIFLPGVVGCLASVILIFSKLYGKEFFEKLRRAS